MTPRVRDEGCLQLPYSICGVHQENVEDLCTRCYSVFNVDEEMGETFLY